MKHIKGMLVFIGLFILVGCAPDQESTKQTTSGPQEDKASEASYRHQSNDFCGGKTSAD
ncbi:hypothetical protein IDE47_002365 [Enterococcus faecalis]|nr:hypothetical protein [Enterococcus faecalis]EGO7662043.1 hypothetical protein [Enterococcus faecalis]EMC0711862.1 hypothetical protein [Enterococcus faecalis]